MAVPFSWKIPPKANKEALGFSLELVVAIVELVKVAELARDEVVVEVVEEVVGVLVVVEVVEVDVDVGVVLVVVGVVLVDVGVGVGVEVGVGVGEGLADDVSFGLSLPEDPSRLKTTMLAEPPWGTVATQNAEPPAPFDLSLLVTPLPSTRQGKP